MALQFSDSVRNARLDAIESTVGTTPHLRIYSGTPPANCAASATGTLLVDATLASDWAANASGGTKTLNNLPISTTAGASGNAGYFRIWDSGVVNCLVQGTVTVTGSGGDMTTSAVALTSGQTVDVLTATFTDGNP